MREIKFRGQMVACKDWVYGDLVHNSFNGCSKVISCGIKPDACYPTEVYSDTVCQYTGLKDKNGKEIYEGDILRFNNFHKGYSPLKGSEWDAICIVGWQEETASFKLTEIDGNKYMFYPNCWFCYSHEIIGNIHENPELLK